MKTNIFTHAILAAGCAAALSGCDDNAWNDKLDGFEEPTITDVKATEYTLTADNYKAIASNKDNKALAGEELAAVLAAVGTNACFTEKIDARDYVPAFLNSTTPFSDFYSNGSVAMITYTYSQGFDEVATNAAKAEKYTVTSEEYQANVWESDEDYIEAFSPLKPANRFVPGMLKAEFPDAENGDYVLVSYNMATQEPVFGDAGGNEPEGFTMTSVLGDAVSGMDYEIKGVVMAACSSGFILSDASGSIFCYRGSGYDPSTYPVGSQVTVNGTSTSYNGLLQIGNQASVTVEGEQDVTYPSAVDFDGATLDATLTKSEFPSIFGKISGKVVYSGTRPNINIEVEGAATAKGSLYYATADQMALVADGTDVTFYGYAIYVSGGKYVNFVFSHMATEAGKGGHRAPAVNVPVKELSTMYQFNGTSWGAVKDMTALCADDYTEMGQSYPNLSAPDLYLPTFLAKEYPYAQDGDVEYVVYNYYADKTTTLRCDKYAYTNGAWTYDDGRVTKTAQFQKKDNGKWEFCPEMEITLYPGKGQESSVYYQACVDWVFENIDKPLGSTSITDGKYYVTSYGNNEYYCGTSAYQGNVDLRGGSARAQYEAGWAAFATNDDIVAEMKRRFCEEVMPAALSIMHPDKAPEDCVRIILHFSAYDGATTQPYTAKFKTVSTGKYEFEECDW